MEKKRQLPAEDILQYIWRTQSFKFLDLYTTCGQSCFIKMPGILNKHAGPDFKEGRIVLNQTEWLGPIEIHIRSSDWRKHGHHEDKAYNQVILHVVFEDDEPLHDKNGNLVPTIELKNRIPFHILKNHKTLLHHENKLACSRNLQETPSLVLYSWREKMISEKLEIKSSSILEKLKQVKNDWEFITIRLLARSFGFHYNSSAMQSLLSQSDISIVKKLAHNNDLLEAYFFGTAGLLPIDSINAYVRKLIDNYQFLSYKFRLKKPTAINWHFARIRPQNYPTIRIAQYASILTKNRNLFRKIIDTESMDDLYNIFDISEHPYWSEHYLFDKKAKKHPFELSKTIKNNLIINAILPLLYAYSKYTGKEKYAERSYKLLEEIKFEKNAITKLWDATEYPKSTALDSQAMHHCYNKYCIEKKCTQCPIGHHVLQQMNYRVEENIDELVYIPAALI